MALRNPVAVSRSPDSPAKTVAHISIPAVLAARITRQCPSWSVERLTSCTFARNRGSSFPECKAEIEIFDDAGTVVIHGREFTDNRSFFWDS